MKQNDYYANFRPELTEAQRRQIEQSEKPAKEYKRIAIEAAKKQLEYLKNAEGKTVVFPDEPDICLRFPGVDPRGQYSAMDMRFKSRAQQLDAVLNLREEKVRGRVEEILASDAALERMAAVKELARTHRILSRAEKLCWDREAAESLHIQMRKLEVEPAVAELDLVFQGLEYLVGLREQPVPEEVQRFYRQRMGVVFTAQERTAGRRLIQPAEGRIYFSNFENVLLQALFSMPENWELTLEELEALRDEE